MQKNVSNHMEIVGTARSPAHTSPTQIIDQVQNFVPIIPLLYILCKKTISKCWDLKQSNPGRGVSEKVSAVGFCLGSGLFGS